MVYVPLLIWNLAQVPTPWFDEGLNLAAARTLAETGKYALPSADGLRLADPAVQSGPPFIFIMSQMYNWFGSNIAVMRLVVVIFGLLALAAIYSLTWRLYGPRAALITVILLLIAPGNSTATFVMMSRQALGEIPSIFLIALGLHAFLFPTTTYRSAFLAGLCFGLAATIKSQVLLILTASLFVWIVFESFNRRRILWSHLLAFIVMLIIYGSDAAWRNGMAGDLATANSTVLAQGMLIHILPFRGLNNFQEVQVPLRLGLTMLVVVGVILIKRSHTGQWTTHSIERFLILFVIIWIIWYAFISIGWSRYGFVGQIFGFVLLGHLIDVVWRKIPLNNVSLVRLAIAAGIVLKIFVFDIREIIDTSPADAFYNTSDYLRSHVPEDEIIFTWEWMNVFTTDNQYILPPTSVTNDITASIFLERHFDEDVWNAVAECPRYVLLGSFSVDRTIFASALKATTPEPLYRNGPYELYEIPTENLVMLEGSICRFKE